MNNLVISFIRTVVPSIVGAVLGFLTAKGIELDNDAAVQLTALLTTLFTGVYYLVVRTIEQKYPQAGYLLGVKSKPKYK